MGALPQPLEVIFEVQRKGKGVMKKKTRKIIFPTYKTFLFFWSFFFSLDPPTFKPHKFF
jgi:hypothetical protein